MKNNKLKLKEEICVGNGEGPSKSDAEIDAAKQILCRVWRTYPQTLSMA